MLARAMLCLFLVLVHTAEDMVLLKRVHNRDNKLLESLRRKLMEDNFDYEQTSEPSEPSSTPELTHSVLSERNKFVPGIEAKPSEYALSYQPQYSGRGEPLPEPLGEPLAKPSRRALEVTDLVVYV